MPSSRYAYTPQTLKIYMQGDSYLYCAACELNPDNKHDLVLGYTALNTGAMLNHLDQHKRRGDIVPDDMRKALLMDDATNFPEGGSAGGFFNKKSQDVS